MPSDFETCCLDDIDFMMSIGPRKKHVSKPFESFLKNFATVIKSLNFKFSMKQKFFLPRKD